MTAPATQHVAIVQRVVPHYRVGVFNRLAARLRSTGVELRVFAGAPRPGEALRDSRHAVDCCCQVENRYLAGGTWWQPLLRALGRHDLVILEQANGALINYPTLLRRQFGGARVAFWGHGANLQARQRPSAREIMKRTVLRYADHWFAYTMLSRDIIVAAGCPPDRITVLENSQPTEIVRLRADQRDEVRRRLGVGDRPTAVFCARLMPQKGLGFLLDGCRAARRHGVDLQLVVMGDGPLAGWLTERTSEEPWIHAVGPQFGTEKARLLAAADVFTMPSGVGLSILDAFAAGLPVIAADLRNHNPEIAYLEHGRNGVMAPADPVAYGAQLAQLLTDERECKKMSLGARATAGRYTVDNMVNNFAAGIEVALGRGRQVRPVDTSVA